MVVVTNPEASHMDPEVGDASRPLLHNDELLATPQQSDPSSSGGGGELQHQDKDDKQANRTQIGYWSLMRPNADLGCSILLSLSL